MKTKNPHMTFRFERDAVEKLDALVVMIRAERSVSFWTPRISRTSIIEMLIQQEHARRHAESAKKDAAEFGVKKKQIKGKATKKMGAKQ